MRIKLGDKYVSDRTEDATIADIAAGAGVTITTTKETATGQISVTVSAAGTGSSAAIAPFAQSGTLTVGAGASPFPFNGAGTIVSVVARVNTAPTGASLIVDVNKNGTTIFTTQANRPTVTAGNKASSVATPDVTSFAAGDYLTVDIDQVGATIAGADLVVNVEYTLS